MVKLIAIVVLLALLYILLRYKNREEIQKGVVITVGGAFVIYLVTVVVMELMH
ncbi:hypothetical protein VA7868_02395 [Vibrio aerogenes CECT 7868]|uniref:Uncharacterized protein n=1 Tax=Vibrio aerogenes CECT 7868 TaxID=1216006 RepID=A0A1M5Z7B6_9VIBR|nr:hypothetical protein [Vibrio aerogenes]SHI20129.1 hypothetical protein VA7868_02395 [Vibrio aerogenes CECT 7868]